MSLVLFAGSSFSSRENSSWKLRVQNKYQLVIATGPSCGKHRVCLQADRKEAQLHESDSNTIVVGSRSSRI